MAMDYFDMFVSHVYRRGLGPATEMMRLVDPERADEYAAQFKQLTKQVKIGYPPKILAAPGSKDEAWYPGPQPEDQFWPPFPRYLRERKQWQDEPLQKLDECSSKIIAFTSDPSRSSFRTKALIVGHVQSGKTTNFTGVIGKAADVGYKVVIVLSGIHNGLRTQTQARLKQQLFDLTPGRWMELTGVQRDFQPPEGKAIAYLRTDGSQVVVLVVKKWHTVLKKLNTWLKDAKPALANLPALIIDDEADQASIDTATINPQIRSLLQLFPRCTYLGYTATPFANVLIDPTVDDDLYPESFILSLPRPAGYHGTESIFGRESVEGEASGSDLDGHDMVREVPDTEVDLLRPKGRAATAGFQPALTPSLRDAVRYFWLATAVRRLRGDHGHSTMLIHTSMTTSVHESFKPLLERCREKLLDSLRAQDPHVEQELRELWLAEADRVHLGDHRPTDFDHLLPIVQQVIQATTVVLDNCRSRDRLDYSGDPVVAIAVGGNTLSRGLTLEGLITSFFVRSANTYDTLLQMGRWFGFRPGYEDLPRIWMTDRLRSWFRHLATVEHEIRLDIERYEEQDLSPRDVGVRIRTHPVLNVTAKMGAYRIAYASYGGRRVQTRYFRENDHAWLKSNTEAARHLVQSAIREGAVIDDNGAGQILLREVDVARVLDFLSSYQVHEDSPDLDMKLISRYIQKENAMATPSLLSWTVGIMGGPPGQPTASIEFDRRVIVGTISRSKMKNSGGSKADIKTLMSKEHRVVDLDISPAAARSRREADLIELRDEHPTYCQRGLILLYPIDKDSPPDQANVQTRTALAAETHVIGLALVFPGNASDKVENSYVQVDTRDAALDDAALDDERAALSEEEA